MRGVRFVAVAGLLAGVAVVSASNLPVPQAAPHAASIMAVASRPTEDRATSSGVLAVPTPPPTVTTVPTSSPQAVAARVRATASTNVKLQKARHGLATSAVAATKSVAPATTAVAAKPAKLQLAGSWQPQPTTGLGKNFLFGESCPVDSTGAAPYCFMVTAANDGQSPNGAAEGQVFRAPLQSNGTVGPWNIVYATPAPGPSLTAISCAIANNLYDCYAVGPSRSGGSGGGIVECTGSNDGCAAQTDWVAADLPGGNVLYSISCADADHCAAVGAGGTVIHVENGSAGVGTAFWYQDTVSSSGAPQTGYLLTVACPDLSDCTTGGQGGLMARGRIDSGSTNWAAETSGQSGDVDSLNCAKGNTSLDICISGADQSIANSVTSGYYWKTAVTGTNYVLGNGCTSNQGGRDCSAGGPAGDLRSTLDGTTWTKENNPWSNPSDPAATMEIDGIYCGSTSGTQFCHAFGSGSSDVQNSTSALIGRTGRGAASATPPCTEWNLARDFRSNNPGSDSPQPMANPNHDQCDQAAWQYRLSADEKHVPSAYTLLDNQNEVVDRTSYWSGAPGGVPWLGVDTTPNGGFADNGLISHRAAYAHPLTGQFVMGSWTATSTGSFEIRGGIKSVDSSDGPVSWAIDLNGVTIASGSVPSFGQQDYRDGVIASGIDLNSVNIANGGTLDFIIDGKGHYTGFNTQLDANIRLLP